MLPTIAPGIEIRADARNCGRAAESSYDASGLIAAIIYYAILLITLQIAFGSNPVSDLLASIVTFLDRAEQETTRPTTPASAAAMEPTETVTAAPVAEPVGNGHR